MTGRSRDWFRQAERDLEHALESQSAYRHEWACFAAHQAAEKAVKYASEIINFVRNQMA